MPTETHVPVSCQLPELNYYTKIDIYHDGYFVNLFKVRIKEVYLG